jgi:alginate O-acetyltransferase complex protein AlgI
MAIGLGKMFGFRFRENFNYPYVARTLREFWKRWHISLSSWFRDYVYIPLGGNRVRPGRVYFNLFVVFLLTGIWHGASWNFVVWGLFHGVFLAGEHMGFSRVLERAWRPLQHLYLLLVVVFSWVFFKAETLAEALQYCAAMLDFGRWSTTRFQYEQVISEGFYYAFPLGCILAAPLYPWVRDKVVAWASGVEMRALWVLAVPRLIAVAGLLFICAVDMAASTYNPFIYFRF